MSDLADVQKSILKALSKMKEPAGWMEIGEKSGVPWRTVMAKLRPLKKEGYVESPVEWKYVVTCKGKKAAAWLSFLLIEKNAM